MPKRSMQVILGCSFLLVTLVHADPGPGSGLQGLWEGVLHGGRGDQPAAMVLRPRGESSFVGMLYLDGEEFGPMEAGRIRGDSLLFRATNYPFAGLVRGKTLSLTLFIPHGSSHDFSLTHTASDTTLLPASVRSAASKPAAPALVRDIAPDSLYLAHQVPTDRAPGILPCLRRGTLLLVGGGAGQSDLYARFQQLAGGATARIVTIPTAHIENQEQDAGARRGVSTSSQFAGAKVEVLHTFSRREADSEEFVKPLRTASGVWIDGGEGTYLLNAYMGTRTERELIALLDRGGVIAGTSAGALIWGSRSMVFRAHPGAKSYELAKSGDLLIGDVHEHDLGVLQNVAIVPHFTEFGMQPALEKMLLAYPGLLALGIDEATAIEVHGDTCTVRGRSNVSVFRGNPGKPLFVLQDGARFDLRRLSVR